MKIFWSWQSDTPGKTGRHFVREALNAAVKELKQQAGAVEEPTERENRAALHVDQDRQGISGSPDLARIILDKIDASTVVVADVTPVSVIPASTVGEDERPEKRNMNPNVAIELGYALRALSDRNVLMVLNTHYGDRKFLPFDLAHKAGPIEFNLSPDADPATRLAEAKVLKGMLISMLRPFLGRSLDTKESNAFREMPSTLSAAAYFNAAEPLATLGEASDKTTWHYPDGEAFYLRLIPTTARSDPYSTRWLYDQAQRGALCALYRNRSGLYAPNRFGAIAFEPKSSSGGKLNASTQVFRNGELWGVSRQLLPIEGIRPVVPAPAVEETYRIVLPQYARFMSEILEIAPPYTVEAGVVGLNGRDFLVHGRPHDPFSTFMDNEVKTRLVLNDTTSAAVDGFLLRFFEDLFEISGYPRPPGFFGFPVAAV